VKLVSFIPIKKIILLIFSIIVILWSIFPIFWFALVSFTIPGYIPEGLELPKVLSLISYKVVLGIGKVNTISTGISVRANIKNSIIIATLAVTMTLGLSLGPSYVFSRFRASSSILKSLLNGLLVVRMIPPTTIIISLFLMINRLKLIDTYIGVALVQIVFFLPVAIWLMTGFFDIVPYELEEQAYIDGASKITTLTKITLPLAVPGLAVTAAFVFLFSWIDYLIPLTLTRISSQTLPLAIAGYMSPHQTFYNEIAAASIISMVPLVFFFIFCGKYIIKGLTIGAFK